MGLTKIQRLTLELAAEEAIEGKTCPWRVEEFVELAKGRIEYDGTSNQCMIDDSRYWSSKMYLNNHNKPILVRDFYEHPLFRGFLHVLLGIPKSSSRSKQYNYGAKLAQLFVRQRFGVNLDIEKKSKGHNGAKKKH